MRRRLSREFLTNYLVMLLIAAIATYLAVTLLSFGSALISGRLMKNRYPARSILREDYREIDASAVVAAGGGVQVINGDYEVVYSAGLDTIGKSRLSPEEFTAFLTGSGKRPYNHDIVYQPEGEFWLVVTFPTSLRLDLSLIYNKDAAGSDFIYAGSVLVLVLLVYLSLLAGLMTVYSRITASAITTPLRKLRDATRILREGDYSVRVDLRLKNEFAELQDTFNDMADRIEREMALRERSERNRRDLVLGVSHDLRNPLANVAGYAELCLNNPDLPATERAAHLKVIRDNSEKANMLFSELLELSKMDSPEFKLNVRRIDACEYLRQVCGGLVPLLERAGFHYEFDIPEEGVFAMIDPPRMDRVFQNLADNAIRYNPAGTTVRVGLRREDDQVVIAFSDDGCGIPGLFATNVFKPFVRLDGSGTSGATPSGSGLGLSIARRIAEAHGGQLSLLPGQPSGSAFMITLPIA